MKIMVSACLAGENCKYNGGNNRNGKILQLMAENESTELTFYSANIHALDKILLEERIEKGDRNRRYKDDGGLD